MKRGGRTRVDWGEFGKQDREHRLELARLPFERKVEMLKQLQEIAKNLRSPKKRKPPVE